MGGDGWYGCDRSGGSACVIRSEVDMYCGMCEVEGDGSDGWCECMYGWEVSLCGVMEGWSGVGGWGWMSIVGWGSDGNVSVSVKVWWSVKNGM